MSDPAARPSRFESTSLGGPNAELWRLGLATLALIVLMAALGGRRFASLANLESMAFQFPELGLLAFAITLPMLAGGIDLSVVGIANLCGVAAAMILTRASPEDSGVAAAVVATAIAIASGLVCGLANGLLVGRARIPPILATLATMQAFTGIALVATGGRAVQGFPPAFTSLGTGSMLGVPAPLLAWSIVALLLGFVSSRTTTGLETRLLGTNPVAAVWSGLRPASISLRCHLASGAIAAVAGLVMIARTNAAKADYGSSYLLQAVLVAVLGGVDPNGGFGRVLGVSVAVVALQVLQSGFTMLRLGNFAREFAWGLFLLAIIALRSAAARRRAVGG